MMSRPVAGLILLVLPLAVTGCPRDRNDDELTVAEATETLEDSSLDSQAQALTTDTIEISTRFTIGGGVEAAADELQNFYETELPCAEVTLTGATLTIDYGVTGAGCLYHGHVITGESQVSVSKNDANEVVVEHRWTDLSNTLVELDGEATVTWNLANPSRHVVHHATITRLRDGAVLETEGDRTQKPLEGGLAEGFQVDGTRAWTTARGDSSLSIDGVQMRWADPVPQAGTYLLTTPKQKEISISFARKDLDTITVTLVGPRRTFVFDVSKNGTSTRTQ